MLEEKFEWKKCINYKSR